VIVDDSSGDDWFKKTQKLCETTMQEQDMLDFAFGVEKTSRLGCQIILSEELSGMIVKVPQS
jgi:2Fe-2S ferredoxin